MSFQKYKSTFYCVGGRHRSAMENIYGNITSIRSKILIGYCSMCIRKKSMTVSVKTIQSEGLGDFYKNNVTRTLSPMKFLQAITLLKTFLNFFQRFYK